MFRYLFAALTAVLGILSISIFANLALASSQYTDSSRSGTLAPDPNTHQQPKISGPSGGLEWRIVESPNVIEADSVLYDVAAVSQTDVWAVGYSGGFSASRTLIQHWNGSRWAIVPSPNPGSLFNRLYSLTVVSANDIWAVGAYGVSSSGPYPPLILRYNGSQWSVVSAPHVGQFSNSLNSISAVSANDIWAVGSYFAGGRAHTLTQRWNGTAWSIVPSPNVQDRGSGLGGVTAISANDVWAVGSYLDPAGNDRTLTMRWNGALWVVVPSPNAGYRSGLSKVQVVSPNDIWAVGYGTDTQTARIYTLVERWNGLQWTIVPSPSPGSARNYFSDLHVISANDIWAVGDYNNTNANSQTLTAHWDGTQWSVVPSPNRVPSDNWLFGVAAASPTDVWAVGHYNHGGTGRQQTLIERYSEPPLAGCQSVATVVPSPNYGTNRTILDAVDVVSPTDIWAVGHYNDSSSSNQGRTLTLHWNGVQWSQVPSPNTRPNNVLYDVAAISTDDVWAVGFTSESDNNNVQLLIMHWGGSAWSIVPGPSFGQYSSLSGVDAVSANNVWAVGTLGTQALTLQWNGAQWLHIPSPSTGTSSSLSAVAVGSATDVWAVGSYVDNEFRNRALALRWNGSAWTSTVLPAIREASLRSVAVISPTDVWAVGAYYMPSGLFHTLTLHWDGSAWSAISAPDPGYVAILFDIGVASPNSIYAVGQYSSGGNTISSLVMHWDGTAWASLPSPNPASFYNSFLGMAIVSPLEFWAVGGKQDITFPVQTLTVRYLNPCITPTPLPTTAASPSPIASSTIQPPTSTFTAVPTRTATNTVLPTRTTTPTYTQTTPTSTPARPTDTAAATATIPPARCAITFTDVPTDHTFYSSIICLACRGIISGYSDGTFRPGNEVTRGQLSKIVANAAGFSEPVGGQRFNDVPPTHTFYEFIERMAARGIISGYSDGTFRPGNNATRGQISKIVANAAGFAEPVSGQTFIDVPSDYTFYEFIERMARRGIIGGYADGTFRPSNNATRGQTSKIVANSFFPNCQTP